MVTISLTNVMALEEFVVAGRDVESTVPKVGNLNFFLF